MGFIINNHAPSTQIDNHDGGIVTIHNGSGQNENTNFLPTAFSLDQGVKLCQFLIDCGFIPEQTDRESFLCAFGCKQMKPSSFTPIKWLKNKELLRETVEQAYMPLITSKSITKKSIESIIPKCFIDKDGKQIFLSNHKEIASTEMDSIRTFFSTFRD